VYIYSPLGLPPYLPENECPIKSVIYTFCEINRPCLGGDRSKKWVKTQNLCGTISEVKFFDPRAKRREIRSGRPKTSAIKTRRRAIHLLVTFTKTKVVENDG